MTDDLGVNVIIFPLAIDLDKNEEDFLNSFLESGGKLVVLGGIGPISDNLKTFLSQRGVNVEENIIAKSVLTLEHKSRDVFFELPVGNFYSVFTVSGYTRKIAANWKQNNEVAIGGSKNLAYIGYSWGQDTYKSTDIATLLRTLEYFWNGITARLTKPISKDEYKKIAKQIIGLKEEANSIIQISEEVDLSVPKYQLKKHFEDGVDYFDRFNSNYLLNDYLEAREDATDAKNEFALVYSLGIPVRKVEVRAVWLDRGTIVGCKNEIELRKLIKNLARLGFNIIFFETVNAGYPIYPSKILPQNPLTNGWDPLKIAVEAAHIYGVELHAWVWTFAVGNTRHNLLINLPVQYPGPIITLKGRSWALAGENGRLRIEMQPETWISPGNKKACDFLVDLFSEIVRDYDVDGLQFDYIRFPFQKQYSQVGLDFITKNAYQKATGRWPVLNGGSENAIWTEWKIKQVNDFVKDTSFKLKQIKPNLKISGAVFALDRSLRLRVIQQDWETWLVNRWVDAVYPFYYSFTTEEIKAKLENERKKINDQAIIIPGFNLRVLSAGELAERINAARNAGVLGFALFATEHIDNEKRELLKIGPFREQALLIPYNQPLEACQKLLDEFSYVIEKFTITKSLSVLTESQIQKDVYYLTKELKEDFNTYTPSKKYDLEKKISNLQLKVKDWLALEKYLNRTQRAMYISSYLDQIKTLLNYVQ